MIKINGKYTNAVIYTDTLDSGSEGLIKALCDSVIAENSKIRIMPDVHPGKGCAVGMTMTFSDKVAPGLVGVDIGCGMELVKVKAKKLELVQLDKFVQSKIPSGMNIRTAQHRFSESAELEACIALSIYSLTRLFAVSVHSAVETILLSLTNVTADII